jgi:hypothetical protein
MASKHPKSLDEIFVVVGEATEPLVDEGDNANDGIVTVSQWHTQHGPIKRSQYNLK